MPRKQAKVIELTEKEHKILNQIQVGTHSALHLKQRAEIVLLANNGKTNNEIEKLMGINGETVTKWRNRFASSQIELIKIETENPLKLREAIEKTLMDEYRSGKPSTFTDEQVACIILMSCQKPKELNLPFSHWTPELLKDEAIKRGIVKTISTSQIRRFLKRERFKTPSN
jgi:transposase